MQQRFVGMSKIQKAGTVLVGLLLSCFLCSKLLPDAEPTPEAVPFAAPVSTESDTDATATDEPEATATERAATATDRPEPTDAPTEEPTAVPPTAVPPTAVPATAVPPPPTDVPAPAAPVDPRPGLDPFSDVNCSDFTGHAQAQAWWEFHRTPENPNPGRLDGARGTKGVVCESN